MSNSKKSTIEDEYQKMDHHEHVLELPDSYVGGVELDSYKTWVYDDESNKIINSTIDYVPGLYKIFDEIIVNSRDASINDKTCKNIKITVDKDTGYISCYNDGNNGIPVVIHKEHKIYVPDLIFGHLLTSRNYKVTGKIVGGKNGYGAKLANIFSKEFYVEVVDKGRKLKYTQTFKNNMPMLAEIGQFGYLRSPDASAARYIETKITEPIFAAFHAN